MSNIALQVENVSKQYRLGQVGTGSIQHDLNRFWHKIRGKEDPYLKIGEANDRTQKGNSDYVWALKDINFEINQGDAVGIIGRNGAGKSTLLKLLSQVTKPTTGSIKYKGRIASLLEVGTGFHPEMTGRENIYLNGAILGMTRREITRKFDEIVAFSGVERYIDTPVKRYSSGMYVRLAFAVAAHLESEILIVDEVLAVGDAEFQKKCLGKMGDVSKGEGRTVLFVSHNMDAVERLCTSGIYMKNGLVNSMGSVNSIIDCYNAEFATKENSFKKDDGFIRYLKIEQEMDSLKLSSKVHGNNVISHPNLGFVISDMKGNKIFGQNFKHTLPQGEFNMSGLNDIVCHIKEPKLLDGEYLLSIWFGDTIADHEVLIEIVMFNVKGMKEYDTPLYATNNGPIASQVCFYIN